MNSPRRAGFRSMLRQSTWENYLKRNETDGVRITVWLR